MSISALEKNDKISNFLWGDTYIKRQKLKFFFKDILNDIDTKNDKNNFVANGLYNNYDGKTKTTFALHPFTER